MSAPHIVFAGGGTGGHLFPGIAVAHAVRQIEPGARITFFTTDRPLDRELLARTPTFEQVVQPVRPLRTRMWTWPAFVIAWQRSKSLAGRFFRENPPTAILGLGGYAAAPPVIVASRRGVRSATLNQDAIPGKANVVLSKYVDLVAIQWDVSRGLFPSGAKCETIGCPIRADFAAASAARGYEVFGLDPARPLLVVTGASQGARSVNQALVKIWPRFQEENPQWQLLHLTGHAEEADVRAGYAAAGAPATVVAFTHEMAHVLAAADLVISRAGASTLAELTALGKPSILLPYPFHRDQHQRHNGQVLADAGAAILLEDRKDADLNEGPLLAALEKCADTPRRQAMAMAAKTLGRPDAAKRIAEWLLRV